MLDVERCIAGARDLAVYELLRQRLVQEIAVPNPSAGAEWSVTSPLGEAWELISVQAILSTSAVVAARQPGFAVALPDGRRMFRIANSGTEAANLNTNFSWLVGLGATIAVNHNQAPLPTRPFVVPGGSTISSVTGAFDVGDQYSAITLVVVAWSIDDVRQGLDWLERRIGAGDHG